MPIKKKKVITSSSSSPRSGLPINHTEPTFSLFPYGSEEGIVNNNCYAYSRRHYKKKGNHKLQPGDLIYGNRNLPTDLTSCKDLIRKVLRDAPEHTYISSMNTPCKNGFWKAFAVLDKDVDYHFYLQHNNVQYEAKKGDTPKRIARRLKLPLKSIPPLPPRRTSYREGEIVLIKNAGLWSHKRGLMSGPLLVDAKNKPIHDPRRASRNYGDLNYDIPCTSFCFKPLKTSKPPSSSRSRKNTSASIKSKKNNARL